MQPAFELSVLTMISLFFALMQHLQFGMIRQLMDELEIEMEDISKEQVIKLLQLYNEVYANVYSINLRKCWRTSWRTPWPTIA